MLAATGQVYAKWPWQSDTWPWNRFIKPRPPTLNILEPAKGGKRTFTKQSSELYALVRRITETNKDIGPCLVIVTHGWKDRSDWYKDLAMAIRDRVDANSWICGWYDWAGQANRLGHTEATQAGRLTFGPSLGAEVVALSRQWRHVHLIGLDSGAWLINEAARVIASHTGASVHLTFLDPYIPPFWRSDDLGAIGCPAGSCWADHYLNRELPTEDRLPLINAHNVDISTIEPGPAATPFSCRWYVATVVGRYQELRYKNSPVYNKVGQILYGFARGLEAGRTNWEYSLKLKVGNEPVLVIAK